MSQEKTLDNTESIKRDIKELEIEQDTKKQPDETTSKNKSSSRPSRSSSSSRSKSKSSKNKTDSADTDLGHSATAPKDAGEPHQTTLTNIQAKLSDPKIQEEIVINMADLVAQFSRRKLTVPEQKELRDLFQDTVIPQILKIKKKIA